MEEQHHTQPGLVRLGLFVAWPVFTWRDLVWFCVVWHGSAWLGLARGRDLGWCGSDGFVVVWLVWLVWLVLCVLCMCGWLLVACGWVDRLWFAFRDPVTVIIQDMTLVFCGLTVDFCGCGCGCGCGVGLWFDQWFWRVVCWFDRRLLAAFQEPVTHSFFSVFLTPQNSNLRDSGTLCCLAFAVAVCGCVRCRGAVAVWCVPSERPVCPSGGTSAASTTASEFADMCAPTRIHKKNASDQNWCGVSCGRALLCGTCFALCTYHVSGALCR